MLFRKLIIITLNFYICMIIISFDIIIILHLLFQIAKSNSNNVTTPVAHYIANPSKFFLKITLVD